MVSCQLGSGQLLLRGGRRGSCSGTQASGTKSSRISMSLCRRWWNSCRISFSSSPHSHLFPSRLSQCRILPHGVPPRRLCRDTQLAEQLAEVPTILYILKQRIPEQIVDNPVPHGGRGASGGLQGFLPGHSSLKRTANKIADLPAPRSGVRRLQGFLPEQSSTATSSSSESISERNVEQIAVSRGFGEGLQDFLPGQSSPSSPWKSEHCFEEQYLAIPRASVYIAFGRISLIFFVTVDSDFPAQFALENPDIIFTCSQIAVRRGFRRL